MTEASEEWVGPVRELHPIPCPVVLTSSIFKRTRAYFSRFGEDCGRTGGRPGRTGDRGVRAARPPAGAISRLSPPIISIIHRGWSMGPIHAGGECFAFGRVYVTSVHSHVGAVRRLLSPWRPRSLVRSTHEWIVFDYFRGARGRPCPRLCLSVRFCGRFLGRASAAVDINFGFLRRSNFFASTWMGEKNPRHKFRFWIPLSVTPTASSEFRTINY